MKAGLYAAGWPNGKFRFSTVGFAMNEHDADLIEYDLATHTGSVVFPADHLVIIAEVLAYFDDISSGKVKTVNIAIGGLYVQLARDDAGNWTTIAGPDPWS